MEKEMPVYVKIDNYNHAASTIQSIQQKVTEAKKLLTIIEQMKNEEEAEIESWRLSLDDVDKKMQILNGMLFAPKK